MPHYTEMNCEEVQVEETTTKTDNKNKNKNKNLGKFNKKSIYLNNAKYCSFLNYNKINYEIPKWLPLEKIDLEIASNLINYNLKYQENKKDNDNLE